MKKGLLKIALCALSLCITSVFAQKTYHVNINSGDDSNDGLSWNSAVKNLQVALDSARLGDTVFVAEGIYNPTKKYAIEYKDGTPTTNRNRSFMIPSGVTVMGGFPDNASDETSLNSRNWEQNETILSGDFDGNDDNSFGGNSENAYHVVIMFDATPKTVLDGFYIYGGNSNETETAYHNGSNIYPVTYGCGGAIYSFSNITTASPTLKNLTIQSNVVTYEGGGLFNYAFNDDASPEIENVKFINNISNGNTPNGKGGNGAGLYIEGTTSAAKLTNVLITGNSAHKYGGGAYFKAINDCKPSIQNSLFAGNLANAGGGAFFYSWVKVVSPTLTNVTISGNKAVLVDTEGGVGGGLVFFSEQTGSSTPTIQNSAICNNKAIEENEIYFEGYTNNPTYEYSFVKGMNLGGSNLDGDIDPMFANPADADFAPTGNDYHNYQLRLESPLINKGNNAFLTLTEDLNGSTRVYDGKIDIGAYESQGTVPVFNETIMSEKSIWSYQGKLYVHIGDKNISMNVYSVNGMLVKQINGLGEGTYEYSLPQGCYIVTLNNGTTQKVIIR